MVMRSELKNRKTNKYCDENNMSALLRISRSFRIEQSSKSEIESIHNEIVETNEWSIGLEQN